MKRKSQQLKLVLPIVTVAFITGLFIQITQPKAEVPQPNLNIFGMEDGNERAYDDGTTERVYGLDPASYPHRDYMVIIKENGNSVASEWYGISGDELQLWTVFTDEMEMALAFDQGLTVAWYPLEVGDMRESDWATDVNTGVVKMKIKAEVLAYESVSLNFDNFDAYKMRATITVKGGGVNETGDVDWWVVPYLGIVQSEEDGAVSKMVSFAIGGSTITQVTDADEDDLKDYQEFIKHGTDWEDADTDNDGCKDGPEVFGGRNPNLQDAEGDVNNDCATNLQDAILVLKALATIDVNGLIPPGYASSGADVNLDSRMGSPEAVYVMQKLCGMRQ
jgi:hypothetical protein